MMINGYEVTDGVLDLSGSSLFAIENKAFLSAKSLRRVILPAGIEHVGDWAFAKCDNLMSVSFKGSHTPGLFGKEVFKGCDRLTSIDFEEGDAVTSKLLALCANKLPYDHLLRSDDVGQQSWYEKWDISLEARLKSDDAEARMSAALCGEEDISYDGIGSVDGEMPGETGDYVQKEEYNRCGLCYIRLANDKYLGEVTRKIIEEHIISKRFGTETGASFYSVFEEEDDILTYLRIYLDIVKPDRQTLKDMIARVPGKNVYARSYLIERSSEGDVLANLML